VYSPAVELVAFKLYTLQSTNTTPTQNNMLLHYSRCMVRLQLCAQTRLYAALVILLIDH
jgi:hypothetical protein